MRGTRPALTLAATLAAALAAAGPSPAAVTIGVDLAAVTPNLGGYNCNDTHDCTVAQLALTPSATAPGGLASPVAGTIVRFRVEVGSIFGTMPIALRVIRPVGGSYMGAGTSALVAATGSGISPPFAVNLPIRAGDLIGLDCCQSGSDSITSTPVAGLGEFNTWGTLAIPPLADGETRSPDGTPNMNAALLLNADVEPSNAFSLKRRRPRGGRVRLVAKVPNPGRLVARDVSFQQALSAAAAPRLVKRKVVNASAAGKVRLNLRLTRRGRSLLRRLGTLRLRIKVVYTPTFGKPATRRKRARLSG